jgi:adenosylhomocysteine nucleosidase|tara:strand:- start:1418 stop:2152 length:735 start_codon:yes stop_codon:yes gene_type:complete
MIGIISAMREEINALFDQLQDVSKIYKGKRTYYSGVLYGKNVVLVFSRWGKVAAAATTTQLINDYEIDEIIFTGVAGSIHSDLDIGDIVIGRNLYQHDMDASPLFNKFEIPIIKKTFIETTTNLNLIDSTRLFLNNYSDYIDNTLAITFNISTPKVVHGDIASGDQFISSISKVKQLNKEIPTAICVEMEGAAVAQVCYEYEVPFSIIRIISDKADDNSSIDFPLFAYRVASKYPLGILKNYFT